MELSTFTYSEQSGWSCRPLPELDSANTLILAFGAPEFGARPGPLHDLLAAYPAAHVVGCSTAGEIFGAALNDASFSVAVLRFAHTRVATAFAPVSSAAESYRAGQSITATLNAPDLRAVLVFSDGLKVNGSELVRGFNSALPPQVIVTGGLAGDGDRFGETWVIRDGALRCGYVTAVGLYGDHVRVGHGSKGGWDIFGPERRITRSVGNILYELDGKPALQLYKTYLGERAAELPAAALLFPLALLSEEDDAKSIVRTILQIDEAAQSMIFAGDVPQGGRARLMKSNFDRLVDGALAAAAQTRDRTTAAGPVLAVAISCVGRRLVLGERSEEELEATLEMLPPGVRQVGFYSYGEISPYATGPCDLHNQTMTLTTIAETP